MKTFRESPPPRRLVSLRARITREIYDQVWRRAHSEGQTIAAVVRQLLVEYLRRPPLAG